MRIATWNVDHARVPARDADRLSIIDAADADVLVLTETRDSVAPTGAAYQSAHSLPRPHCEPGERWVSIWTRMPILHTFATIDPFRTTAMIIAHEGGQLLIYGTVLPWHADIGDARAQPPPKG